MYAIRSYYATNRSVAFAVARASGVPVTGRDVFLDNVKDVGLIAREIRKLVHLAIRRGQAVGICHPYPQTLEALRSVITSYSIHYTKLYDLLLVHIPHLSFFQG